MSEIVDAIIDALADDGVIERPCPYCGRLVLQNDRERKMSHEAPECEQFAALMAAAGGTRVVEVLPTSSKPP